MALRALAPGAERDLDRRRHHRRRHVETNASPSGTESTTSVAVDGPPFVTTMVYWTVSPGSAVAGPVFGIERSASGARSVLTVDVLLERSTSSAPSGGVRVAVFGQRTVLPCRTRRCDHRATRATLTRAGCARCSRRVRSVEVHVRDREVGRQHARPARAPSERELDAEPAAR